MTNTDTNADDHERYRTFLETVVSSGRLWGIWRGETWATADDPSGRRSALFMLWPTRSSAEESLKANRAAFPGEADVDTIELGTWLEAYTDELIQRSASPFLHPDQRLNGSIVDPEDLRKDLIAVQGGLRLQATDLNKLRKKIESQTRSQAPHAIAPSDRSRPREPGT